MTLIPASWNRWRQYAAVAVLSLGSAVVMAFLHLSGSVSFQRYVGNVDPLLVAALVAILGPVCLGFLHARGWFEIYARGKTLKGLLLSASLATLLAIAAIIVDLNFGFPRDLNIPPPWSMLFYPAIAFVAETLFHALPLALLLALVGLLPQTVNRKGLVWPCLLVVSLLEPAYQIRSGLAHESQSWIDGYVAAHVFVFNLLQLYVFRVYGFVSMYSLRVVYYAWWHIAWGYARLNLQF